MYADFVGIVNDGKLTDAEIVKIQEKWKLTTDQVVAYIIKIGAPVSYSGTLIDPATAATMGWKSALAALLAYQAALGNTPSSSSSSSSSAAVVPQGPCGTARPFYNYYTGECVATAADIKPRGATSSTTTTTTGDALSAITASTTTKTINAAVAAAIAADETASSIANAMAGALIAQGVGTNNALSSARYTGQAIAAQQKAEQEAAEAALRNQQYAEGMAKRYGGYVGSTMDTANSLMGSGMTSSGTTNITVNVAGSVTSENDLVQTVRTGLLRGQYNGNQITLEAI
jgi:hypothetical protein